MKNTFFFVLIAVFALFMLRCTSSEQQVDLHWKAYKQAMMHGDLSTAVVEVNSILAYDTTSQAVLDTLLRLYFVRGNHISAYTVGNKIEDQTSIHKSIVAESAIKLGNTEEAKAMLLDVEANDTAGLNISSKYKLATLHFNDEEYAESLSILGKIVVDDNSLEQKTRIVGDNAVTQNVTLYAASHNFAGYVFLVMKEYDTAEEHFSEALRAEPNFQLATNNLEETIRQREELAE